MLSRSFRPGLLTCLGLSVIGLSIAIAGWSIHGGLKQFRSFDRYVTVKGLATKDVRADIAIWSLSFTATGDALVPTQTQLEADSAKVIGFLKANGLKDGEIRIQNIQVGDRQARLYGGSEGGPRFILSKTLIARTGDIDAMVRLSQKISDLVRDGVVLGQMDGGTSGSPQYVFSRINDVKPGMIAEATRNARDAARQFAADSGQRVGVIRSASQGMFEILPRSPGVNESETPDKTVRVVTTVEYYLGD